MANDSTIRNRQDREFAVQLLREGKVSREQQQTLMNNIDRYDLFQRQLQGSIPEDARPTSALGHIADATKNVGKFVAGTPETVATIATSAVGAPVGGIVGLGTLLFGGGVDKSVRNQEAVQDFLTFTPKSDVGKGTLETIGKPLLALDTFARDFSEFYGMDNVWAQTAIYTTLTGGVDLLGVRKGGVIRASRKAAEMKKIADELGINMTQESAALDIMDAARRMTPAQKAENAPALMAALDQAHLASSAKVSAKNAQARQLSASLKATNVQEFAKGAFDSLANQGFDIAMMSTVQRRVKELAGLKKPKPVDAPTNVIELPAGAKRQVVEGDNAAQAASRVDVGEVQLVRDRIEADIVRVADDPNLPSSVRERVALKNLQHQVDEFLDNQFMNDMIDGSPDALAAWNSATATRKAHNTRWNKDKDIVKLMDRNATPETVNAYIFGMSAGSPKRQGAQIVNRLKQILGDDHPAINGLRADFLHSIAQPLLQAQPNFPMFIKRWDSALDSNPSLIRALNIKSSSMKDLRNLAVAVVKNPIRSGLDKTAFMTTAISRMFLGHGIAKAGLKVSIGTRFLNALIRADKASQKKILFDAADAAYGRPVVSRSSQAAGRFIEAAFISDVERAREEMERKQ